MKAFIFGAGAHGRIALDILRVQGGWSSIAFVDENRDAWGAEINGARVVGGLDALEGETDYGVVIAIGKPPTRLAIADRLEAKGIPFLNAIHPAATIMPSVRLGRGLIVSPGVVIDTDAQIGDHAIFNAGCIVEHDDVVGRGATLSPAVHLAGRVTLGAGVFVGIGTNVVPRVTIGDGSIVAAGSMVAKDVPPRVMVMGNPARMVWAVDEKFDWSKLL